MTITAKFASRCGSCSQAITPGTKIEWTKGQPVRHTSCPGTAEGVPTATYLGRVLVADLPRGERLMRGCGQCRRLGRMCKSCEFDEYDN